MICLSTIIRPIIGQIHWRAPWWLAPVKKGFTGIETWCVAHAKSLTITLLTLAVIGASGYYTYHWYLNRPKPIEPAPIVYNEYSVRVMAPNKTDYTVNTPTPNPLSLYFSGSVAPIEQIDKVVTQGITLSPALEGEWRWVSENKLVFKPVHDWIPGKGYRVVMDDSVLLAPQSTLNTKEETFQITPFSISMKEQEFYQNPQDPMQKNAIFHVGFTYPVDPVSFEKQLSLLLKTPKTNKTDSGTNDKPYQFTIKYDDKKMDAWIRSEPVSLPDKQSYMAFNINEGVKSSVGGNTTILALNQVVNVPSIYRPLVSNIGITLAEQGDSQQQVLVVNLYDRIDVSTFKKQIHAWILPKRHPNAKLNPKSANENYYWRASDDIENNKAVLNAATPLAITLNDIDEDQQSVIGFKFKAQPGQQVFVSVDKKFTSVGGYKPSTKYTDVLEVPNYPTTLKFMSEGAILALKGERKLSISARNLKGVKLDIKRVIPSQLQHLISLNRENNFVDMTFSRLSDDYFTEQFTYTKRLPVTEPGEIAYDGIDLSDYLIKDGEGQKGVFLVKLYPWSPDPVKEKEDVCEECNEEDDNSDGYYDSRLIVVTDLGIITKRSLDKSTDLFVQSISTGEPVVDAKVSVIGRNGVAVLTSVSDDNGHVQFKSFETLTKEQTPTLYLVEKEGDLSFLPISYYIYDRGLNLSRFDVGGIENSVDKGKLTGYVFSDRKLYRPGDTFNIGTIVRADDWTVSIQGIPLEADIYDSRNQLLQTVPLKLDQFGFNQFSYATSESSPTGDWSIYLYIAGNKNRERSFIGSSTINIKEFEADKIKVELKLTPENNKGWVHPDTLTATVKAENLFGTPAQSRQVKAKLSLRPMSIYFSAYDSYHFYNDSTNNERFETELASVETDENGMAKIDMLLNQYDQASYHLFLLAEVFEAGSGRSVAATAQQLVLPNDYLIGAKEDGDLGYIHRDSERHLNIIAINPNLEKIAVDNLTVERYIKKYLSVLTLQPSGVYKYQSKLKEQLIKEGKLSLGANGIDYALDTHEPGDYILLIKNTNGDILYRTEYSVAGNANVSRSLDRNAELKLKLSKEVYEPDEEIEIAINAPYVGSGLITIEKDKVYQWKWFKADTTSSIQTIRIPKELKGNGYINVQFVRDINADEIFMSPLSYAVLPFKVSNSQFRASVELQAPEVLKPGANLPITVRTNSKQKVVVFAVDEGILQVARYRLTDPLNHFFRKRELAVNSLQILDLILPEYSKLMAMVSAAGGDGDGELDLYLNPFKRKREKPVTYWSGIIDVDGERTVNYQVPDYFNGKLRIMAVSVTPERIGTAQTSTTVRNDFVLSPNVPFMAAPGDEFEITLGVANNLTGLANIAIPITVTLTTTPQLTIVGDNTKTLSLAEKKEGRVAFKLRATKLLGGAELKFKAVYNDDTQQIYGETQRMASISVRPLVPYRTETTMGRMDGSEQVVDKLRHLFAAYAKHEAKVSHSPLVLTSGLTDYLSSYPYLCSEQLISRAVPTIMQRKYPEFIATGKQSNSNQSLEGLFTILRERQNSIGAIGLWRPDASGDEFVTLYAAHYLIEAKENGIIIPDDLLDKITQYLKSYAADINNKSRYQLSLRAYAIYLLTRQNIVTTNLLASLMEQLQRDYNDKWKEDINTMLYLSSVYKMLQMDTQADDLLKAPWNTLSAAYSDAWWSHNYNDPLVQHSTAIYLISKHFPEKAAKIPAQALENMVLMLKKNRNTTLSSAMTILAIDSYASQLQALATQQEGTLTISAKSDKTESNNKQRLLAQANDLIVASAFEGNDSRIIFNNSTSLPTWYSLTQSGYDIDVPQQSIKRGLEIERHYVNEQGQTVNRVKLGEKINVIIKIRSNSNEGIGNVAVVDLLPGGFEVVQQTPPPPIQEESDDDSDNDDGGWVSPIASERSSWSVDYTDIREDRVIIFGTADTKINEFIYQIKATNVGSYQIPPTYGEAMYDREVQAVSASQGNMIVEPMISPATVIAPAP